MVCLKQLMDCIVRQETVTVPAVRFTIQRGFIAAGLRIVAIPKGFVLPYARLLIAFDLAGSSLDL